MEVFHYFLRNVIITLIIGIEYTLHVKRVKCRAQLVCMKVQAHNSLETPQEFNQNQMHLTYQDSL